jgi:hypothetical protein
MSGEWALDFTPTQPSPIKGEGVPFMSLPSMGEVRWE